MSGRKSFGREQHKFIRDGRRQIQQSYIWMSCYLACRSLSTFRSIKELLTALRDAIKGHRSLYIEGKILRRDNSENYVIITDRIKANGFTGILIDLDLAKVVGSGRSGSRHQTGTIEFIVIQVLHKAAHTYRHNLESFFYILQWMCARRAWEVGFQCSSSVQPKRSILQNWYTGDFE